MMITSHAHGYCHQVSHVHPCLLIGRALVLKSSTFILIFTHFTGMLLRRILVIEAFLGY